jgi:histone deacetylase HOS3
MDALTNGLKKVTLKLGSREEHDRKMKERLDGERRARALKGAETRRINKAAKDAKLAESKATPAQKAKIGPGSGNTDAAMQKYVPEPLDFAHLAQGPSSLLQPHETAANQVPFAQAATTAVPQINNTQTPSDATTLPHFDTPTYNPSLETTYPPQQAAEPPAATSLPPSASAFHPEQLQQPHEPSESSFHRFEPEMETTPPSSGPSFTHPTSFPEHLPPPPAEESFQSAQILHEEKPTLPNPATNYSNIAADNRPQLPVFSATGPIPFAPAGQHTQLQPQPTATVDQPGDEARAGAADSHVWQAANRPTE